MVRSMTDWSIQQEFGGSLKDLTLNSTRKIQVTEARLYVFGFTLSSQNVILPRASKLPVNTGAPVFIIVNAGAFDFSVRNWANQVIEVIPAGKTGFVYLIDDSSLAGDWVIRVLTTKGGPFYTTSPGSTTVPVTTTTTAGGVITNPYNTSMTSGQGYAPEGPSAGPP